MVHAKESLSVAEILKSVAPHGVIKEQKVTAEGVELRILVPKQVMKDEALRSALVSALNHMM